MLDIGPWSISRRQFPASCLVSPLLPRVDISVWQAVEGTELSRQVFALPSLDASAGKWPVGRGGGCCLHQTSFQVTCLLEIRLIPPLSPIESSASWCKTHQSPQSQKTSKDRKGSCFCSKCSSQDSWGPRETYAVRLYFSVTSEIRILNTNTRKYDFCKERANINQSKNLFSATPLKRTFCICKMWTVTAPTLHSCHTVSVRKFTYSIEHVW